MLVTRLTFNDMSTYWLVQLVQLIHFSKRAFPYGFTVGVENNINKNLLSRIEEVRPSITRDYCTHNETTEKLVLYIDDI